MTLDKLIQKRIDRLESVPENLLTVVDKQDEKLFKSVLADLESLKVEDGKIVASKENLAKINGILQNLKKTLFNSDYLEAIKDFAKEIGTQAQLNNDILAETVGTFTDDELYKAVVQKSQVNALQLLDDGAISQNLLKPLAEILTNSVVSETGYTKAVTLLKENLTGENSLLRKYAGTFVKDAFTIADRQYARLVSKNHGAEFYRYSGGTVADTRKFCEERHGQIFHEKEIADWGSAKNTDKGKFLRPASSPVYVNPQGEKLYWEGEHYGTNAQTIFSYAGGYSCNHILTAVFNDYVPEDVKQRARSLGYFK